MLPSLIALFPIHKSNNMLNRHKKFLEYMVGLYPDLDISVVQGNSLDLQEVYSRKVFLLLFNSSEEVEWQVPLYINSSSIWLRSAAIFRFSNPL